MCNVYVLCFVRLCLYDVCNAGSEGDSAHLCYLDKVEGGRSTLVLNFKSATRRKFQWIVFKDVNDVLSWKWDGMK